MSPTAKTNTLPIETLELIAQRFRVLGEPIRRLRLLHSLQRANVPSVR